MGSGGMALEAGGADRVVVLGLDCAAPDFLFERWRDQLPNLSALMARGGWGRLRSCHPPITVPAWRVMSSGRDAGQHGVYGFRNRSGTGYADLALAREVDFVDPVWERLAARGLRTTLVGLPGTYPAPRLHGACVSGPLCPGLDADGVWPPALAAHLRSAWPDYAFDVADHRLMEPEALLEAVEAMIAGRFALVGELAARDDWNLLWMVEIGTDRLNHALWHHIDPAHPRFVPDSPLAEALLGVYRRLDARIGELVRACDDGDTAFFVVSDHGARPMVGGFCVNSWLVERGYLTLRAEPEGPTRFDPELVDWGRTRVWGAGGYYARLFFNVQGREPEGIVAASEVEALSRELAEALEALRGPDGAPMGNLARRPDQLFERARGLPPDLFVYLGQLAWRSLDTIGGPVFTEANDTGPDAANHAWDGVFISAGAGVPALGEVDGLALIAVAGMVERLLVG